MKKDIRLLDGLIYSTFFIMTTIILFILYKDIPSRGVLNFVTAYAVFAIIIPFYILIRVMFTVKRFNSYEVKQETIKFLAISIVLITLQFVSSRIFSAPNIRLLSTIPSSLIIAFGLVCFDVVFLKKAK
ncbi:hypothetical protein [Clostridium sp. B9]|uniref:hypothetical protein n=1 Tax=Clostridium sp. B9 TaxID=3423224 RepID=UPI003D2F341C